MITYDRIGSDEDLAREVLVVARSIAPCILSLEDLSDEEDNALAILRRVYKDIAGRGARFVKSQSSGSSSVTYTVESAFEGQPTRALRAMCSAASQQGHSVGSFPLDRPVARIWRERY